MLPRAVQAAAPRQTFDPAGAGALLFTATGVCIGAGALMCEANGLDPSTKSNLRDPMVELITITESFYACGVAASGGLVSRQSLKRRAALASSFPTPMGFERSRPVTLFSSR